MKSVNDRDKSRRPRIGLALGAGGARGWSHIGVIKELRTLGIEADIVCGTSIGALVGAAYAADEMDPLEEWLNQLTWQQVLKFFDITLSGGLIEGKKLFNYFREHFEDVSFTDLKKPYAAVATRLDNGQEIWLREGSVMDAVRASIAVPGFFTPTRLDGHWVVDGGLVNPVPISVCRVLGADIVIAVALDKDLPALFLPRHKQAKQEDDKQILDRLVDNVKGKLMNVGLLDGNNNGPPSVLDIAVASIDIMQTRIMRSRMAGDPPDLLIRPRISDVGFFDFHRAPDAIGKGKVAVGYKKREIESLLDKLGL